MKTLIITIAIAVSAFAADDAAKTAVKPLTDAQKAQLWRASYEMTAATAKRMQAEKDEQEVTMNSYKVVADICGRGASVKKDAAGDIACTSPEAAPQPAKK